jgi:ABC-type antimicrobial peptide transport system permease subunit
MGLAVGFACFAIATFWIRYEMSYDGFHKNADRLYRVKIKDPYNMRPDGMTTFSDAPFAAYLVKTFPEIRNATKIIDWHNEITYNDVTFKVDLFRTDSSFFKIFDIKLIEGNMDFMIPYSNKVAITQKKARLLFGDENPIGKAINERTTVCAVVNGFPENTNYPFDLICSYDPTYEFNTYGSIVVELVPGIDVESFMKKLSEYKATAEYQYLSGNEDGTEFYFTKSVNVEKIILSPLTSLHYKDPYIKRNVKFQHIVIFAVAGLLLILCSLFNYITLFVCRFRIRVKEFALRIVYGSSNTSLFMLLSVEFLMSMFAALVLGIFLLHNIIPQVKIWSGIDVELLFVYLESLVYIGVVVLVSLLAFLPVVYMLRHRALSLSIHRNNRKILRKTSVTVQLIISIGFIFCTAIIIKQMYYLHNTDLGFDIKNHGCISTDFGTNIDTEALYNHIKEMPEIEELTRGASLVTFSRFTQETFDWEGRSNDVDRINMESGQISEEFAKFYGLRLVAGDMLSETDGNEYVLINESAAKVFGWKDPVGKSINGNRKYIIKGVLKNIYSKSPTIPVRPVLYTKGAGGAILFKYREGTWKTCSEKIRGLIRNKHPEINDKKVDVLREEEEYDKFLKSENTLLKILTLISIVCVFVCVFGFVSIVSLTCEERRKEIAIRKINGATIKDILDIFFKEHLTLLAAGALVAFPAGYLIMRRWLEEYVVRTEISAWVYVVILFALFMTIVACVGGKVYKTSRENPVNSIKN